MRENLEGQSKYIFPSWPCYICAHTWVALLLQPLLCVFEMWFHVINLRTQKSRNGRPLTKAGCFTQPHRKPLMATFRVAAMPIKKLLVTLSLQKLCMQDLH